MSAAQHTPEQWEVRGEGYGAAVFCEGYGLIANVTGDELSRPARARRIVQCVNSHDALVRVATEMLELADNWPGIAYAHDLESRARAAIAAATHPA